MRHRSFPCPAAPAPAEPRRAAARPRGTHAAGLGQRAYLYRRSEGWEASAAAAAEAAANASGSATEEEEEWRPGEVEWRLDTAAEAPNLYSLGARPAAPPPRRSAEDAPAPPAPSAGEPPTSRRAGMIKAEGDGSVPLLSLGFMCARGWKTRHFNPAGATVLTREYPHQPAASFLQAAKKPHSPPPLSQPRSQRRPYGRHASAPPLAPLGAASVHSVQLRSPAVPEPSGHARRRGVGRPRRHPRK